MKSLLEYITEDIPKRDKDIHKEDIYKRDKQQEPDFRWKSDERYHSRTPERFLNDLPYIP